LIQFYKGFGFKPNKGRDRDFRSKNTMVLHTEGKSYIMEGGSYVTCMECGEQMKQIQYRHLKYKHNMDLNEYKVKHPTAILVSEAAKNIGDKNPMKNEETRKKHKKSVNTVEYKEKMSEALKGKNVGNTRADNIERNKSIEFRKKISEGVKNSYIDNSKLKQQRSDIGKTYGFGNVKTLEKMYESGRWSRPENRDKFQLYTETVRRLTDANYQKFFNKIPNAKKRSSDFHLDHKYSIKEAFDNNIPVEVVSHYKNLEVIGGRLNESKGSNSSIKLNELINDIQNSTNPLDNRTLLLCGGAYGHMNHPFDIDINLTFGQLKDIVKKALNGELELTREKCIAGDTVIHTEKNGDMTIAEFVDNNVVDKVLSFNEETGQNEYMDVMASFNNDTTDEWLEIELEDGKTIQVTPNHRMYVEGIGYVEAKDLTEDINLRISAGIGIKIKSIKRINKEQTRYDLKVDGFSCYYANDILVHNTDGQALAVSWVNGRLVAARNKSHLRNRGKDAMDINAVASKFAGRGGLTDAYNFAMKDLSAAIDKLSQKQRDKIFGGGSKFMNLEVIYPESVNVIPYGQALLVFHGTFEYDEAGNIIGEDQSAGRVLAGMIKQINQNVQSKYTIQGPPVTKLPKNKELSKLQPKYFGMISKLQSEFGLKDNQGVGEYHQKWWENFVNKNAPTLDAQQKIGLVKRWAFGDKSFRLKEIGDEKIRKWAEKIDKEDQSKISKENLMKFERIFLGVGADVLSFMSSVLTVNPDKAKRAMVARLEKTIKDVEAKGDEKQIAKLRLELQRLNDIGGFEKIVPNEGIVFSYNNFTMKLTGSFASANQLLGIFFDNR
jgi:hypothetical protein